MRRTLTLAVAIVLMLLALTGATEAREVTIAVVRDGPGPRESIVEAVKDELGPHLRRDATVQFKTDPAFDAGWDPGQVPETLRNALDDPEVDIVLAMGFRGLSEAARPGVELTKPVICAFVQSADVFDLAYGQADRSTKANLSIVAVPKRSEQDIRRFRELVGFRKLTIAVTAETLAEFPAIRDEGAEIERRLEVEIEFVGVGSDIDRAIPELTAAEAVYLTQLDRLDAPARQRLFEALNARKIPTFSARGHADVHLGALAGQTPDFSDQLVRRLALNLSRIIRGERAEDLPVWMTVDTRMLINGVTAKAIGWSPDRETRNFAHFLHPEALELQRETLALIDAFQLAEQQNAEL